MSRVAFHCGYTALALAGTAAPAHAQDAGARAAEPVEAPVPGQRLVYTPDDFARFAPRSALDMVRRIPGFSIQENFDRGRGLGQASGNVLINGERISTKSDSVADRLSRISAANVVRIELVDGATLDVAGLSGRVANVVARSTGVAGQFEWQPQIATDYATTRLLEALVSVTGSSGPVTYTLAAENRPFHGGAGGPNTIAFGAGAVERRFSRTRSISHDPELSAVLRIDGPGDSIANVNGSFQWKRSNAREDEFALVPAGAPSRLEQIRTRERGHNYEIGGDFEFGFGPGRLKLIVLESFRRSDFSTQSVIDPDTGAAPTGSRFTLASRSGERIGRAEYRWRMAGGDWQLSAEAAFNRLDNVAGLATLSPAGAFDPVPFPGGTGGVTEDRYEAILSFGRPLTGNLSLQVGAGGEYSKIAQTGTNALSRGFQRPKGSLSLAWTPSDRLDVSFELEREVGQLDFGDFLAEVDLSDDSANAGNNRLRPEQSWELDLEVARDLGTWGSLTVNLFHNRITDVIAIVPLPGGGEAVGNIDSARVYGVLLDGTIRLDPMGFRGAQVDVAAQFRKSRLVDPVTGATRGFDRLQPRNVEIDFRHDVPGTDWAWGGGVRASEFGRYYRVAESGIDYTIPTNLRLFVEHKDVFGLTVQARLNNILEDNQVLRRTVYAGPRDIAAILFRENRQREIGRIVNFTVKGNF